MTIDDRGLHITVTPHHIFLLCTPLVYPSIQKHYKHHFLSEFLVPLFVLNSFTQRGRPVHWLTPKGS
uniref:Uncharacterized protein n=1 Tax=Salix viminalis TaxID=40686 RepID=A0A6N2LNU1_SALVM